MLSSRALAHLTLGHLLEMPAAGAQHMPGLGGTMTSSEWVVHPLRKNGLAPFHSELGEGRGFPCSGEHPKA